MLWATSRCCCLSAAFSCSTHEARVTKNAGRGGKFQAEWRVPGVTVWTLRGAGWEVVVQETVWKGTLRSDLSWHILFLLLMLLLPQGVRIPENIERNSSKALCRMAGAGKSRGWVVRGIGGCVGRSSG